MIINRESGGCISNVSSNPLLQTFSCNPDNTDVHWNYNQTTRQIINSNGNCMQLNGGTNDRAPIESRACSSSESTQVWKYDTTNKRIINEQTGTCLTIDPTTSSKGGNTDGIYGYACGGSNAGAQKWDIIQNNELRRFKIRNPGTEKCIDISGSGTDGSFIQLFDCSQDSTDKMWYETDVQGMQYTHMYRNITSGLCLNTDSTADGVQLIARKCDITNPNMKWARKTYGSSTTDFKLQGPSNTCVDVAGGASVNGTSIQVFGCDSANQNNIRWYEDGTAGPITPYNGQEPFVPVPPQGGGGGGGGTTPPTDKTPAGNDFSGRRYKFQGANTSKLVFYGVAGGNKFIHVFTCNAGAIQFDTRRRITGVNQDTSDTNILLIQSVDSTTQVQMPVIKYHKFNDTMTNSSTIHSRDDAIADGCP